MYELSTDVNFSYAPEYTGFRELSDAEIENVQGAWVWAAVGAAAGFLSATGEALQDDGSISFAEGLSIAGATLTGAVGGRAVGIAAKAFKAGR